MTALSLRRRLRATAGSTATLTALLTASTAFAAPADAVLMDPSVGAQTIAYSSAAKPGLTSLPVVFTPPTRDAYTKALPLELPCDVDSLAVGVSFKNVSAQPLYIEWSGAVFENGDEKTRIPDAFGRKVVHIADGRQFGPGEVGSGGLLFIAQAPLLSWAAPPSRPTSPCGCSWRAEASPATSSTRSAAATTWQTRLLRTSSGTTTIESGYSAPVPDALGLGMPSGTEAPRPPGVRQPR